jgi:hypothetical protein
VVAGGSLVSSMLAGGNLSEGKTRPCAKAHCNGVAIAVATTSNKSKRVIDLAIITRHLAIYFPPHRGSLAQDTARGQARFRADPKPSKLLESGSRWGRMPFCKAVKLLPQ